ncbi:MAG: Mov34/MPN/PAD-1 family protein [Gemmataceae bacterium]|nr:Mov34/MPN/PAD-1 family protein [Gemmataceae bacterium]
MFQALVNTASRLLDRLSRSWFRDRFPAQEVVEPAPAPARPYQRLERVVLTDEVSRTLFEEYATHREGFRGEEETGWVLLGVREASEAVVLATLPAGAERQAGVAHVRFNSSAQALASRIVRQLDRRLTMLGVLHTHPGSLRHPSDGDYQGDSLWVGRLRGHEGVFGIGTADGESPRGTTVAYQPQKHMQCLGALCLSWYALHEGDRSYRPLAVDLTIGPDLARPLHSLWETIERYAEQLDRLCRQQAGVSFEVIEAEDGDSALAVHVKLAEPGKVLRVVLQGKEARYYLVRGEDLLTVDPDEDRVDRGVYLLLAELAGQD